MDASQDLEGVAGLSSTDSADKSSEPAHRSFHGHTHYIEEIARLKGQLVEATEALQHADYARTSSSSTQLQETIDELKIEKTNVRYSRAPCIALADGISSWKSFGTTWKLSSLKGRILPLTCESASSAARQSLRPCARRLIVTHHCPTVFNRLVSRHHRPSPALFVKRWPDLSEPSVIRILPWLMD
jgi:hypothetical protein